MFVESNDLKISQDDTGSQIKESNDDLLDENENPVTWGECVWTIALTSGLFL